MRKMLGKVYRHFVPMPLQDNFDCWRASRYWRRTGVVFIHTPKCAGISLSTAIYGRPLGHVRAQSILNSYPQLFHECFTFSFVREPVDRYLSAFFYMKANFDDLKGGVGLPPRKHIFNNPIDFVDEWLVYQDLSKVNYIFRPQSDFLCIGSQVVVDYVARYEKFSSEISYLSQYVPNILSISKLNVSKRSGEAHDYPGLEEKIRNLYYLDFELLGYD